MARIQFTLLEKPQPQTDSYTYVNQSEKNHTIYTNQKRNLKDEAPDLWPDGQTNITWHMCHVTKVLYVVSINPNE